MDDLKIKKENAMLAHSEADEAGKKLLEYLFGKDHFAPLDPYILACKKLGKTPKPPLEDKESMDRVSIDAYERLIICVRAKNMIGDEIWIPAYDGTERHHFPYFKWDENSGFGFSYSIAHFWYSDTCVGARLEYRTAELAQEGGREFIQYYRDFLTLK